MPLSNKINLVCRSRWVVAWSLSLLLVACGGGGGGGAGAGLGGGDVAIPPPGGPELPAVACGTEEVSWTVGQTTCRAPVNGADSNLVEVVKDEEGTSAGQASFLCVNGLWTLQASPVPECNEVPPAPVAPCTAQALTWAVNGSTCDAAAPQTTSGSTLQLTDSQGNTTGAAQFNCASSQWTLVEGSNSCVTNSTPPPPPPPPVTCPASLQSWVVGANTCEGAAPRTNSGSSLNLSDTEGSTTGEALFTCANGTWTLSDAATPTCNQTGTPPPPPPPPPPPFADCASGALSWTVESQTCNVTVPQTTSGSTLSLADAEAPTMGTARFACSDGTWSQRATPHATCFVDDAPPLPEFADCASGQEMKWGVAPALCSTLGPQATSGSTIAVTDPSRPTQGTATFACFDGSWFLQASPSYSCTVTETPPPPPAPVGCGPANLSWTVGASTCNASASSAQSGVIALLADTTPQTIGTAQFTCTNGTWEQRSPELATCKTEPAGPLPPPQESLL
jgi:hypothetical protein